MLQTLKKVKNLTVVLTTLLIAMIGLSMTAQSHTLEPFFKDYLLYKGDTQEGAFLFTNTSDASQEFVVSIAGYNPQNEEFTSGEVLATPLLEEFSLEPNAQIEVPFQINIPPTQEGGSYFNILVIEEKLPTDLPTEDGGSAAIKAGFGGILAMHVIDEGGSIKGAFAERTGVKLEILDRGIPYFKPTKIRYTYQNNSNYVFQPTGEIRAIEDETDAVITTDKINPDGEKVYPEGEFVEEYEYEIWDYQNLTKNFKFVARTYNQYDDNYLENAVILEGFKPVTILAGLLGVLIVVYIILRLIKWLFGSKKTKKMKKE